MLTAKQHELLHFIQQRLDASGISPSFEEMKEALGLKSKSGIHRLISALEERGFLRRLPNRARALEVMRLPGASNTQSPAPVSDIAAARARKAEAAKALPDDAPAIAVPLVGKIAAGLPIEAIEDHEQLAVPQALLGPGEHYALQVAGDSMIDAGIFDGDFALIRKAEEARDGEIVVALIEDSEATLKYFRREGAMVRLDPANRAYDPQRYAPAQVRVQGRLSGILRRYE